jgi:hypothetical protein
VEDLKVARGWGSYIFQTFGSQMAARSKTTSGLIFPRALVMSFTGTFLILKRGQFNVKKRCRHSIMFAEMNVIKCLLSLWIILSLLFLMLIWEGEPVNRPKMDINRKTCNIRTWEKHLFLDISSIDIDILVPSLYQYFETCSIEVFWLVSANSVPPFQPLRRQRNVCTFLDPAVNRFMR